MTSRSSRNLANNNILMYRRRRSGSRGSGAFELIRNETQGLAIDFTDSFFQPTTGFYGSANIKDTTTPANNFNSSPTRAASSLLTYTSPSVKMCMGPSGTLRYGAHNFLIRSEDFENAAWSKNSATFSTGTLTATSGTGVQPFIQNTAITGLLVVGGSYKVSIRAKVGTHSFVQIAHSTLGAAAGHGTFNLSTGAVSGSLNCTAAIVAAADGYYDCSIEGTTTSANLTFQIFIPQNGSSGRLTTWNPTGSETVLVSRSHVFRTPGDSTYLATTTAARYALPLEWNSSGVLQGLLVEEARTSLITYSQQFDNAAWIKDGATVTADAAVAPDGTTTADKLVEDTTVDGANHRVLQIVSGTTLTGAHTLTVYAKAAGRSKFHIRKPDGRDGDYVIFDLSAETTTDTGTGPTATSSITSVGSGWYRCRITVTAAAAITSYILVCLHDDSGNRIYTGDGVKGVHLWGAQIEAGSFPTSYIQTFASTVTRAADNISLAVSAFPSPRVAGTVFVDFAASPRGNNGFPCPLTIFDSNWLANSLTFYGNSGVNWNGAVYSSSAQSVDASSGRSALLAAKLASAHAANDYAIVANGGSPTTDATVTVPTALSTMQIGDSGASSSSEMNTYIRRVMVLPRRMSNAELQTLTAA